MPLVMIQHKKGRVPKILLEGLAVGMPGIVAASLHVEENKDAHLTPDDVEVHVQESGESDVNTKDLEITIWANLYPERLENLGWRKENIVQFVRDFLTANDMQFLSGFVWVLLQPASFGEL